jgi:hypothetical protein
MNTHLRLERFYMEREINSEVKNSVLHIETGGYDVATEKL